MKDRLTPQRSSALRLTPLDYAYRLLARRAQSEHDLAAKMLAKGFTEGAVDRTVARLKEQGYLNDAQLAEDQVERLRKRGFGAEHIRTTLLQHGIDSTVIAETLPANDHHNERTAAQRFLASRFSADALKQPQIYARAFRLLLRRGYDHDVVESLLGEQPEPVATEKE
jgi:regulatory protein